MHSPLELLQHGKKDPETEDDLLDEEDLRKKGQGIRCPRCRYRPKRSDRWMCEESCRHIWNTFDTRGKCPACGKQWLVTWCPGCKRFSAHEDWYGE